MERDDKNREEPSGNQAYWERQGQCRLVKYEQHRSVTREGLSVKSVSVAARKVTTAMNPNLKVLSVLLVIASALLQTATSRTLHRNEP